jgi:ankyrin repeat protein
MFGAGSGEVEVVRLLLEAGADPNRRNASGQTALMSVVIADGETDVEEM